MVDKTISPEDLAKRLRHFGPRAVTFPRCYVIGKTEKALLVLFEDASQHWIPLSQIDESCKLAHRGDEGDLVISTWIAEQKGLLGPSPTAHVGQGPTPIPKNKPADGLLPAPALDLTEALGLYRALLRDYHPDVCRTSVSPTDVTQRITTLWRAVLRASKGEKPK